MKEIWKPIKGYEGLYEISNKGRVKSLARYYKAFGYRKIRIEEKIMSPVESPQGYYQIGLSKEGAKKHVQIHRLVAQAFIPNPQNLPFINHKDENKKNNCIDNLEWCTPEYNVNYGSGIARAEETRKTKKIKRAEKIRKAKQLRKLAKKDEIEIVLKEANMTKTVLANDLGITIGALNQRIYKSKNKDQYRKEILEIIKEHINKQ